MKNCLVVIVCGAKSINNFDEQNGCTSCDKKVLTRTRGALHYITLYHQKYRKRLRDFFLWKIFLWVLYDNIGTLVCPKQPHVTMVFQKHFKTL